MFVVGFVFRSSLREAGFGPEVLLLVMIEIISNFFFYKFCSLFLVHSNSPITSFKVRGH